MMSEMFMEAVMLSYFFTTFCYVKTEKEGFQQSFLTVDSCTSEQNFAQCVYAATVIYTAMILYMVLYFQK